MDYWFSAIFPSGESLPGNMGMNAWLGKSNCHSSFPLFLPSLLYYRHMTGQSCSRSLHCFSSTRHRSITSCFLTSSSNKSLSDDVFLNLCLSCLSLFSLTFCLQPYSFLLLDSLLLPLHPCVFFSLLPSEWWIQFPVFFSLSPSCHPSLLKSPTLHNQSAGPFSLHPFIPKSLTPLCSPSFHRFPKLSPEQTI